AREIIAPILYRYKRIGWSTVLGSYGTIISVTNICQKLTGNSVITKDFLNYLITMMMDKREVEHICFEGLREDRDSVLGGGV
ncbi:Ppx/GppA family phosphatase, partial [Francisella tularensis subsp. holarctica]|nr:Ppx/GppA family phosphatase [Francisella tularensis subsp. holarctica]